MDLIERAPFLAQLDDLLRLAAARQGHLVLLGGEAGVGKTVLNQEWCHSTQVTARVLMGACDPLSTPRPLGPLVDIASVVGGEVDHLLRQTARRD